MKYILLLTITVMITACNRDKTSYQDKDKWIITEVLDRVSLRGKPKQVTEYTIFPPEDTARPEKRRGFYIKYGFDSHGSVISKDTYMQDSLTVHVERSAGQNGLWQKETYRQNGLVRLIATRRLHDGRYLTIYPNYKGETSVEATSFLADGDEEVIQDYPDSSILVPPNKILHYYFDGSRIIKLVAQRGMAKVDVKYFYSSAEGPDSTLKFREGGSSDPEEREIYYRNEHGDVVRKLVMTGKDTASLVDCRYIYDAKGNWIRRVKTAVNGRADSQFGDYPAVVDREFVY